MVNHIFVYGSLRRGQGANYMMLDRSEFSHTDTIDGASLYALGWYPGVKLDGSESVVHGDVYRINDASIMDDLDRYEGCPTLFKRRIVKTTKETEVYVYEYAGTVLETQRVRSGDWNDV